MAWLIESVCDEFVDDTPRFLPYGTGDGSLEMSESREAARPGVKCREEHAGKAAPIG